MVDGHPDRRGLAPVQRSRVACSAGAVFGLRDLGAKLAFGRCPTQAGLVLEDAAIGHAGAARATDRSPSPSRDELPRCDVLVRDLGRADTFAQGAEPEAVDDAV